MQISAGWDGTLCHWAWSWRDVIATKNGQIKQGTGLTLLVPLLLSGIKGHFTILSIAHATTHWALLGNIKISLTPPSGKEEVYHILSCAMSAVQSSFCIYACIIATSAEPPTHMYINYIIPLILKVTHSYDAHMHNPEGTWLIVFGLIPM